MPVIVFSGTCWSKKRIKDTERRMYSIWPFRRKVDAVGHRYFHVYDTNLRPPSARAKIRGKHDWKKDAAESTSGTSRVLHRPPTVGPACRLSVEFVSSRSARFSPARKI